MKNKRFPLSPIFITFCLLLGFYSGFKNFAIYFLVVIIHEFAHFVVAKKLGYSLKNIYIMPYGVCLNFNNIQFYGNDEIKIALAGPLVNVVLSILCVSIWWCFPETYYYLDYFCFCNLILGLFNLIPCFPLDGGRILICLISKKYDKDKVYKYTVILNYIISLFLLILFAFSIFFSINFTYLYIAIFLFAGTISPERFSKYMPKTLKINPQKIQKGAGIKLFAVGEDMPIFKIVNRCSNIKFNIIYVVFNSGEVRVLSEINIMHMLNKYSSFKTIKEIRKNRSK